MPCSRLPEVPAVIPTTVPAFRSHLDVVAAKVQAGEFDPELYALLADLEASLRHELSQGEMPPELLRRFEILEAVATDRPEEHCGPKLVRKRAEGPGGLIGDGMVWQRPDGSEFAAGSDDDR